MLKWWKDGTEADLPDANHVASLAHKKKKIKAVNNI
jgi:hypothetical protein